jgi:hypothetical protein
VRDARHDDRERAAQVHDRAPMKLAGAGLADAHALPGLAERERVGVIPGEQLALPGRQRLERALDAPAQILALEAFVEALVGRHEALAVVRLHEPIQ